MAFKWKCGCKSLSNKAKKQYDCESCMRKTAITKYTEAFEEHKARMDPIRINLDMLDLGITEVKLHTSPEDESVIIQGSNRTENDLSPADKKKRLEQRKQIETKQLGMEQEFESEVKIIWKEFDEVYGEAKRLTKEIVEAWLEEELNEG